jgi:hypothetical protein
MRRLALLVPCLLLACGEADDMGGDTPDAATGGVTATFTSLYGDYFSRCSSCHTPTAAGRTPDIEQNLDFTSKATAYTSITTKMAAGLMGNFMDCNGVPFVDSMDDPAKSLIVAALDQPTRAAFDHPMYPSCDGDTIADQTLKVGMQPSAAFLTALKDWVRAGAPNN